MMFPGKGFDDPIARRLCGARGGHTTRSAPFGWKSECVFTIALETRCK